MKEHRLILAPGATDQRLLSPGWSSAGDHPPLSTLLEQVRAIDPQSCERLVFSGRQPLLHPDFDPLAAACRQLGFQRLALETDAAPLAEAGTIERLEAAGFTELRVVVGGIRQKVHDYVMQEPGSFHAAMRGLQRAVHGQARLYVTVPVVRANVDDLEPLLTWLLALGGHLDGFLLSLPEVHRVAPHLRPLLLPYSELAKVSANVFRAAQGRRVEYGFSTKRGITPCATDGVLDRFGTVFHDRFNYLKHTKNERFVRVPACDGCSLVQSCQGIEEPYVQSFGTGEFKPVPLDVSMNWKLRRFNQLEKVDYANVSPFQNDSLVDQRGLIRINGRCNMSCSFCFVDRTAPDFAPDVILAEIESMAKAGIAHLVLSGGEPTLHPDLPAFIAKGKSLGFRTIEIQTNGVFLEDRQLTARLVDAGLNKATLSLHSADPAKSDEITRMPGAFPRTVRGIHTLRSLGVLTQIAHVITKANYQELPDTVRFLAREFPSSGGHLSVCFAIAQGISDLVFQWVIPTFTEIKPYFREALDLCLENQIGFGGMIGQGGYPPCMLDGDMRYYAEVLDQVFKSGDTERQFYKSPRCVECDFNDHCLGPRRAYVQQYGEGEIAPFRVSPEMKQRLVQLKTPSPTGT